MGSLGLPGKGRASFFAVEPEELGVLLEADSAEEVVLEEVEVDGGVGCLDEGPAVPVDVGEQGVEHGQSLQKQKTELGGSSAAALRVRLPERSDLSGRGALERKRTRQKRKE